MLKTLPLWGWITNFILVIVVGWFIKWIKGDINWFIEIIIIIFIVVLLDFIIILMLFSLGMIH